MTLPRHILDMVALLRADGIEARGSENGVYVVIDAWRTLEILPTAGCAHVLDQRAPLTEPERHTLPAKGTDLVALVRSLVPR